MAYYNPHITGQYNPLYTLNNQGIFTAQLELQRHGWGFLLVPGHHG